MDESSIFREIIITVAKEDLDKLRNILDFMREDTNSFEKTYPSFYTLNQIINQIEMGLR